MPPVSAHTPKVDVGDNRSTKALPGHSRAPHSYDNCHVRKSRPSATILLNDIQTMKTSMDRIGGNRVRRRGRRAGSISKWSKTGFPVGTLHSAVRLSCRRFQRLESVRESYAPASGRLVVCPGAAYTWPSPILLSGGWRTDPRPLRAGITRNDRNEPVSLIAVS
jgi:hypothetical protein